MDFLSDVSTLTGVGPSIRSKLLKLGISSIKDLLYHLPSRYQEYLVNPDLSHLAVGSSVKITGTLTQVVNFPTKRGLLCQRSTLTNPTGQITIIWFNQPFLTRILRPGNKYVLAGSVDWWERRPTLISPSYDIAAQNEHQTLQPITPIYHETEGLTSKWLNKKILQVLKSVSITDPLPEDILTREKLIPLSDALYQVHVPVTTHVIQQARERLAFDEIFAIQLQSQARKMARINAGNSTYPLKFHPEKINELISSLHFHLTPDQRESLNAILTDLQKNIPMNRLLEGDVGSGKTIVAAISMYAAVLGGYKSAMIAPTQILAAQHFQTFTNLFATLGVNIGLVTSQTKRSRKQLPDDYHILIGTHALFSSGHLDSHHLALVVIDEQHKFGVHQRSFFTRKHNQPHLLTMTATPIPRTIALTVFGHLDISRIDSKPQERLPVTTWVVPEAKRSGAYEWIKEKVGAGEQAFIVCPFIDPSESQQTVKSATEEFNRLQTQIFPQFRLSLLHGRLKSEEKDRIMTGFSQKKYQILVTTPVVEVGIDVPNSTIMVIEDAHKFGLSQLHQLRGRVGRGNRQSYCLLFSPETESERLLALRTIHSGTKLAELDLALRGPGELTGEQQHGLKTLKVATYTDLSLIERTLEIARIVCQNPGNYPSLQPIIESAKIPSVSSN